MLSAPATMHIARPRRRGNHPVTIGLLRQLDPEHLLLYGGRRLDREDWEQYRRQYTEHTLVATRQYGTEHVVVGTLEFRIHEAATGAWGMLDRLYVDGQHRRHGIASELLAAVIRFARERHLTLLKEHIPNVLRWDRTTGFWHPHTPGREGWGGLRSLGATIKACAREHQPCTVLKPSRNATPPAPHNTTGERMIGAILALPIVATQSMRGPNNCDAFGEAQALEQLVTDLARAAGVRLHRPNHYRRGA